ncbi:MAG: heparan-alpha-glucosaminide N-acetyltransferase domain-containing protein [bacterium]
MATAATVSAAPQTAMAYQPPTRQRVDSIDVLRGLVMVIMMLDHTRDYFSTAAFQFDPTDLEKTSVVLFLTRWITHYCAPTFFFLAGTGAYLRRARGVTAAELSSFLVSRGIWLIFLELTIVRYGISGDLTPHGRYLTQTIWALGWSMLALAALVHLPLKAIGTIGITMVLAHNAFDGLPVANCGPKQPLCGAGDILLRFLHVPGPIVFGPDVGVLAMYPLIPWIGVMGCGYVFGKLYTLDADERRRLLVRIGTGITALYVVLRATNLYGDASKWSVQTRGAAFTVMSFLNVTKYPPSLLYLCMTIGPGILLLAFLERERRGWLGSALVNFGRVPMLFYLLQWLFAHGTAYVVYTIAGKPTDALYLLRDSPAPAILVRSGFSLPVVYAFWIAGVLTLYPICRWYAGVKKRRRDWWLGYL